MILMKRPDDRQDQTVVERTSDKSHHSLHTSRRTAVITLLVVASALVVLSILAVLPRFRNAQPDIETRTVAIGNLRVRSLSQGTLESTKPVEITCQVESHSFEGRRSQGAQILWMVPNGSTVKKGDLLVQFDDALLTEIHDDWHLKVLKSTAAFDQAVAKYINERESWDAVASETLLKLQQAELSLKVFTGKSATELSDLGADIRASQSATQVQEQIVECVEKLEKLGFRSEEEEYDSPIVERHELLLEKGKLATAINAFVSLQEHKHRLKKGELEAAAKRARLAVDQAQRDHESKMTQLTAETTAATNTLKTQLARLKHYGQQIKNCNVYAPSSGFVVYANSGRDAPIRQGAMLRERQKVMTLHDTTNLQIRTGIHAPAASSVKTGMPATIQITQNSGQELRGRVASVQQQGESAEAIIKTNSTIPLRPGAAATVEILLNERRSVVLIPLSSLASNGSQTFCYVISRGQLEQRPLTLGAVGDQQAEVVSGVNAGEEIVLFADSIDVE
jgi:HlyD family secretion protein